MMIIVIKYLLFIQFAKLLLNIKGDCNLMAQTWMVGLGNQNTAI